MLNVLLFTIFFPVLSFADNSRCGETEKIFENYKEVIHHKGADVLGTIDFYAVKHLYEKLQPYYDNSNELKRSLSDYFLSMGLRFSRFSESDVTCVDLDESSEIIILKRIAEGPPNQSKYLVIFFYDRKITNISWSDDVSHWLN